MVRIISAGNASAIARKLLPPVSAGLLGIAWPGVSAARTALNFALGAADGVVVGEPTYEDGYAGFVGLADFVQTEVVEPTEATFFAVCRSTSAMAADATRPMFFGTFESAAAAGGGNTFGVSMVAPSATVMRFYASRGTSTSNDTSVPLNLTVADTTDWGLYSAIIPTAGNTSITSHTDNVTATSGTVLARFPSVGKFRLGSGFDDWGGSCDLALWVAYNRVLTATERATMATWCRAKALERGITV